jgi:murein DD-endopeptidase MepM/ murein hydrolase activator NlpD
MTEKLWKNNSHKKENKNFTIMIIPHSGDEIRRVKIPKAVVKITCGIIILTLSYTSLVTFQFTRQKSHYTGIISQLNSSYQSKSQEFSDLNNIAENQQKEIEDLKSAADIVRGQLDTLSELEQQIRDRYGLQAAAPIRIIDSDKIVASRGLVKDAYYDLSLSVEDGDLNLLNYGYNQENDEIFEVLNSLSNELETKAVQLESLVSQVDSRLTYLEHRPSRYPVSGRITSSFGYRVSPTRNGIEFHYGIDLAAPSGTPIYAPAAGTVVFSDWNGGYGRLIIIDHGYGIKTLYAHNSQNLVKVGETVKRGELIGRLGSTGVSTGPHTHFEIRQNNVPVDPVKFLNNKN